MKSPISSIASHQGTIIGVAIVVALLSLSLALAAGGQTLAVLLYALTVGAFVHHAMGEPQRVRYRVRKRTSALQDLAYRDSLTGLPNRRFFTWYLEQNLAMRMANRRRGSHINRVVLFDLNGFKAVNDTYGHEAGDELLRFIALTVTAYLPSDALMARLGGDEFVVMVRDNSGGRKAREVEATIRQAASSTFIFDGQSISVSASVGVSSPANSRSTAVQLLREADQRMYADKQSRRERQAARQQAVPAAPQSSNVDTQYRHQERRLRRRNSPSLACNRS
jgi:diguanylate cyclase (GGDEF)-like protein